MTQVLKGHIVHVPALDRMDITENGFLVLEDGVIAGVYHTLPDCYAHAPLRDFGDKLDVSDAVALWTYWGARYGHHKSEFVMF